GTGGRPGGAGGQAGGGPLPPRPPVPARRRGPRLHRGAADAGGPAGHLRLPRPRPGGGRGPTRGALPDATQGGRATAPLQCQPARKETVMWKCGDCGRRFYTSEAGVEGERIACPGCGSVEVDIDFGRREAGYLISNGKPVAAGVVCRCGEEGVKTCP